MEKFNTVLKDLNGESFVLKDLIKQGKLNLLFFYNNDCLGCTGRALPLAYEFQQTYEQLNLIVIHSFFGVKQISTDDIRSIFIAKEAPFPIYLDNGHALFEAFECQGTPHWAFVNDQLQIKGSVFGSQDCSQLKLDLTIQELLHEENLL